MTASQESVASKPNRLSVLSQTWFGALLLALLSLGGTFLLYREALGLPFFFDDMIHLRWLDWHTLPSVWTTAEGLGYYRPLTMSFWKIGYLVLGYYDPMLSHLLNLMLHGINTALTGFIAWRLWSGKGHHLFALLAALFFLSYPFSFQAIPSSSSLSKPLIATLMLGSVALYWEARRRNTKVLLIMSLLLGFLAPFAYESGVMTPLAIVMVELVGWRRQAFSRWSWSILWFFLLIWGIALPLVLLNEPDTGVHLGLPQLTSLWSNGIYFSQGLLFPVASLSTPLSQILSVDPFLLLAAMALVVLSFLVILFHRRHRTLELLYSLSWFAIAILPLWLTLDFAYVINGARLLYLGAVGSALLWAGVPVLVWYTSPAHWWTRALAAAMIVAILAFNVSYVRHKMGMAAFISTPLWQAVDAAERQGDSASLLYVNVPGWVAPKEPTYSVGTEGLTFIPEYVRVQDFLYVNSGVEPTTRAVMFDPVRQDQAVYLGDVGERLSWEEMARAIREADSVYLTTYAPDRMQIVEAGALEQDHAVHETNPPQANFADRIGLLQSQVTAAVDDLHVTLWWSSPRLPEQDVTLFLHVYDVTGKLVAQGDGYPLRGLFPPRQWQPGDTVRDVRTLHLPADIAGQPYKVVLGWYDTASGERLPAYDVQRQRMPDDAVLIYER